MKQAYSLAAVAALLALSACDKDDVSRSDQSSLIKPWQAKTILGGGDGQASRRQQGRVTSGQLVKAGQGTIYPGRQPIFRGTDFVDNSGRKTISLSLVDVSIKEAADAILGELLKENYILDPGVQGTVNIVSTRPVSRATAIEVFEVALKQNGAALVRRGDVFAITPMSGDLTLGASTDREVPLGYSIRVVPLKHIGAQEMATILQPFAGDSIVGIDAQRNIIVLAGTSADQKAWQQTINSFDVNWLASRSVGIFPIKGRSAQSILSGLEKLVETDESFEPLVVFEVIPENNSILAVAKTARSLESVDIWIKRLTQEGANDAQVYSYDMKYARASTIAPTLSQILGVNVQTAESEESAEAEVMPEAMAMGGGLGGGSDINATRIVASKATNTLLIHATNSEYQRILGILHRLDVPPRQVMVEATIVEVTLNDDLRYGVQYYFNNGQNSAGLTRSTGSRAIATEVPGFSAVFNVASPKVIVDALDEVTDTRVVSSPSLMILNNESARLVVGDQVPISVKTAQDASDSDVFVSTVEFRETGVIFEVTPRINSSGSVVLNINQEVSKIGETDASTGNPSIEQRSVSSSISVDSGETVALGGLFETRRSDENAGMPGTRRMPLARALLGRNKKGNKQTELVVLITPRIVNNTMDARRVTRQLRERVQQIRLDDATLSSKIKVPSLSTSNSEIVSRRASSAAASQQSAISAQPLPAGNKPAASAASATSTAAAAKQAIAQQPAARRPASGDYYAYLGAFKKQSSAMAHWQRIQGQHAVLSALQPRFIKEGSLVTLAAGPMSQKDASDVCVRFKSDCYSAKGK